jgi:hypothetical protein
MTTIITRGRLRDCVVGKLTSMMMFFPPLSREESISIYRQISSVIPLSPSDKLLPNPEIEFPFRHSFRDFRVTTYDDELLFFGEGGKF